MPQTKRNPSGSGETAFVPDPEPISKVPKPKPPSVPADWASGYGGRKVSRKKGRKRTVKK